jgi:hypothetical protein
MAGGSRIASIEPPVKVLVMIFDARDEWEGGPLNEALVRVLESHGLAGATELSGVMGYGAHRGVHQKGLIGVSACPMISPSRYSSSKMKPSSARPSRFSDRWSVRASLSCWTLRSFRYRERARG